MLGNNRKKIERAGFTLLEIVVVLAIFSILAVIVTDVFMLTLKAQRQTVKRQTTAATIRYVVETIARQIRTSEIDYTAYASGINNPANTLILRDQNGTQYQYATANGKAIVTVTTGGSAPAVTQADLTNPDDTTIIRLNFYITPVADPFSDERCAGTTALNGCQPTAKSCTVTDESAAQNGFCCCQAAADCATGYCDFSSGAHQAYTQYCASGPSEPGGLCRPANQQPRVTIVAAFESLGEKPEERKTMYLQTTVGSRIYKR